MDSLRLVDVAEGGELVLMTGDGRSFTLAVDDELRAAVRKERLREPVGETRPGPREVQARVRGGESAEEIAEQTGLDVGYVRRFEGAILAEREHVARLARGTTMDRGADGPVSLEEATLEVLATEGVAQNDVAWDSRKLEGTRWEVRVDWRTGSSRPSARWRFDVSTRVLEPVGAEAERISGRERQQRRLSAVRESVFDVERAVTTAVPTSPARAVGGTVDLLDALARQRGRRPMSRPLTPSAPAADVAPAVPPVDEQEPERTADPPAPQEAQHQEPREQHVPAPDADGAHHDPEPTDVEPTDVEPTEPEPADLEPGEPEQADLDPADVQEHEPTQPPPPGEGAEQPVARETGDRPGGPVEPDLLSVLGAEAPVAPPRPPARGPAAAPAAERRSGSRRRSSVPSWDDIVFGTRRDEGRSV